MLKFYLKVANKSKTNQNSFFCYSKVKTKKEKVNLNELYDILFKCCTEFL